MANSTSPFASRDRLILELLLGTGIRLGSLVGLNVGDVDLQTGDLYLVQRALGHRQITTEIYARVSDERPRRAVSCV